MTRVQIARGLVGQHDLGIVDQCAGDADALLLAAGKLRGQVVGAVFQSHALQGVERFLLVGHAVEVLRQHDVFERSEIGNQMELLKDEADFFRAHPVQVLRRDAGDIFAVEPDLARRSGDPGSQSGSPAWICPSPKAP